MLNEGGIKTLSEEFIRRLVLIAISLALLSFTEGCSTESNSSVETKKTTSEAANSSTQVQKVEDNQVDKRENEEIVYNKYTNSRYGFSIDYPNNYKIEETSQNRDGAIISSDKAKLIVFGNNNVLNYGVKSYYDFDTSQIKEKIKYKVIKDNWFIISWIEGDNIVYQKTVVGKGSANTFIFTYSKVDASKYDEAVKRLNESFKTPGINESH
ncbi:hypothetical protein CPJCM30710_19360 [Clostridium polyendosporum]|uniref:Uncharacterized protein n=1 Tax=Clostridium polyendosporum TaxID=69208 RepID=A0A919RZ86_9CLOT|nr:hypothetical protein CPJCM30710_19360 [Clostridium polyendosporum]